MKRHSVKAYLGIDIGSATTKFALLDGEGELVASLYMPTAGKPVAAVQQGLREIGCRLGKNTEIAGVATTGGARYLGGFIAGADIVKNEITCHAVAAMRYIPEVQTVIEIGGQDSKIIVIRDGVVVDFGMNTVCAAGTGSFLDHQADRLNINIDELSRLALESTKPVQIAGKCTVFAESDMVHKQQTGCRIEDILCGLCRALVRNYLSNVGSGKDIRAPVVFQGGVAFNRGIVKAFNDELGTEVVVPLHHEVMGAIGAAMLVCEAMSNRDGTRFKGFSTSEKVYATSSFECKACPRVCEVSQLSVDGEVLARWGGRCDLWERSPNK